jgi:hypothetical protein
MGCWMESNILWIVLPLNALGDQQARTFRWWGIIAMTVIATVNYLGLRKVRKSRIHSDF